MRATFRNLDRQTLCEIDIDPDARPGSVSPEHAGGDGLSLDWDAAVDDTGFIRKCPACNCRELFVRRDFPQAVGMGVVVIAGIAAVVLFALNRVLWGIGLLTAVVVIDALVLLTVGRCLVCYRCRSEYRDTPIADDQSGWDLATGEKYRA